MQIYPGTFWEKEIRDLCIKTTVPHQVLLNSDPPHVSSKAEVSSSSYHNLGGVH